MLVALRRLLPDRPLRLAEALTIAERQANRLLELSGIHDVPVPLQIVTDLPRLLVEADPELPGHAASGASDWDATRRTWVISINPDEPRTRQRYTVLHEYKHVIDHYHSGLTGPLPSMIYGLPPTEYLAEYFAGCVLMPGRWLKAAFYDGIQRPTDLAELFDVSPRAIEVRLAQLGLRDIERPSKNSRRYRWQPRSSHRYRRPAAIASSTQSVGEVQS